MRFTAKGFIYHLFIYAVYRTWFIYHLKSKIRLRRKIYNLKYKIRRQP